MFWVICIIIACAIYFWNKKRKDGRARLAARRERTILSIYDTSNPTLFGQIECVVCLQDFANTQTYSSLPCGHIFCEECMSLFILKHKECPTGGDNIYWNDIII
jgi:hypothetical protein